MLAFPPHAQEDRKHERNFEQHPFGTRLHRQDGSAGKRLLGPSHPARHQQLPGLRHHRQSASGAGSRLRHSQARLRHRQRGTGTHRRFQGRGHPCCMPGNRGRQAGRSVPGRCYAGRRRYFVEHEHERGNRQPRARNRRPSAWRLLIHSPERRCQRIAIHQRHLSGRLQARTD